MLSDVWVWVFMVVVVVALLFLMVYNVSAPPCAIKSSRRSSRS
jgi:hypothetical protein